MSDAAVPIAGAKGSSTRVAQKGKGTPARGSSVVRLARPRIARTWAGRGWSSDRCTLCEALCRFLP